MNTKEEILSCKKFEFKSLVQIMEILRGKDGCPWDVEQNHHSIRQNFIEETYEVIEAIDNEDSELLCEELGDVLLQVVFHARIEEENKNFSISDVIDGICKKLILRHPHIFSDVKVTDTDDVLENWDKIKNKEKGRNDINDVLNSVPKSLPALMRADKVLKKSAKTIVPVSIEENIETLKKNCESLSNNNFNKDSDINLKEKTIGEMLMAVVNIAREIKVDSEIALTREVDNFIEKSVNSLK